MNRKLIGSAAKYIVSAVVSVLIILYIVYHLLNSFGTSVETSPAQLVTVNETIPDLVVFAEQHGTTYARLKEANLWLRESKLNDASHRQYEIIIPR